MSGKNNKIISGPSWKWWYHRNQPAVSRQKSGRAKIIFQSIIAFAVAALFAFIFHRVLFAVIVAIIGFIVLICGLFIPKVYSAIERIIGVFALGVGQFLTWLLLVPFYYLCFLPARMLLTLTRHDPMKRAWDPPAPTYWDEIKHVSDSNQITRQY